MKITGYQAALATMICGFLLGACACPAAALRVGIFDFDQSAGGTNTEGTLGDEGIYQALEKEPGIAASFVNNFAADTLKNYDVLILPQTDPKLLPADMHILKQWVADGHGLMTTHDAVGYRRSGPSLFPEICGGGVSHQPFSNKGIVCRSHPVVDGIEPKTRFQHSFDDHVVLVKGTKGIIVLREICENEKSGYEEVAGPILIVGEAGKGRYAASGMMPGWDRVTIADSRYEQGQEQEMPPRGIERQILINTIRWLADSTGSIPAGVSEELVKEGEKLGKLAAQEGAATKPSAEEAEQMARIKASRADIFPLPKKVEWGKIDITLAENGKVKAMIVVDDQTGEKELLGAEEIAAKCKALGNPGMEIKKSSSASRTDLKNNPLVIIGTAESGLIREYLKAYPEIFSGDYLLTKDSPGQQGYIIRCFTDKNGTPCILLGGSDAQGTLYACYTFLYLMKQKDKEAYAVEANIRDWPDYGYRFAEGLYTFRIAAKSPPFDYVQRTKAYIDFLARHKINGVTLGRIQPDVGTQLHLQELSAYGRKRGVYVGMGSNNTQWERGDTIIENIRPECGVSLAYGCCYGDDMMKRQADVLTDFCRKYAPGMLSFHCIDSDPFAGCGQKAGWWKNRCSVCQAKYKDDERWMADRDQFKSMYAAVKAGCPDTKVVFVQWPYHAAMMSEGWPLWSGSEKQYQQYLDKVTADLPEDALIVMREASRSQAEAWDRYTRRHAKLVAYYTYNGFGRWVSSCGRDAATWWTGNRNDCFVIPSYDIWLCYEVSMLIGGQYGWTVKTPGYKIWSDRRDMQTYNMSMKPTYEPAFVFETLLPLICRDIYGEKAGPYVEKALKTNMERGLPGTMGKWQHSRWEVDIEGKRMAENGKIVDPLKNYGEIRDEANVMYANMAEAMKVPPENELRRWVMETLWYKARELRCRGEGFYHWVQAAKQIPGDLLPPTQPFEEEPLPTKSGDKAKAQEELNLAVAYLDRERDLMKEAGEKGYPAEVAGMGYVPTGYGNAPYQNIRTWAQKKNLVVPSDAELKKLLEKTDNKPQL